MFKIWKLTLVRNPMQEEKSILAKIVLDLLEGIEYTKYTELEDDELIFYTSQHERYKHVRTQDLCEIMGNKLCLVREHY